MIAPDDWVALAEVARPHGVRGEVRLKVYNQDSDVLLELDEVLVRLADGTSHEVSIDGARRASDAILLKLHSIDDRNRADEIRGASICVRRGDFPALDDGEFYACDVVGAKVVLGGAEVGVVTAFVSYPSVDVLACAKTGAPGKTGTFEVPLVEAFVGKVDVANGVVELLTLPGLEEDARDGAAPDAPRPTDPAPTK